LIFQADVGTVSINQSTLSQHKAVGVVMEGAGGYKLGSKDAIGLGLRSEKKHGNFLGERLQTGREAFGNIGWQAAKLGENCPEMTCPSTRLGTRPALDWVVRPMVTADCCQVLVWASSQ